MITRAQEKEHENYILVLTIVECAVLPNTDRVTICMQVHKKYPQYIIIISDEECLSYPLLNNCYMDFWCLVNCDLLAVLLIIIVNQ